MAACIEAATARSDIRLGTNWIEEEDEEEEESEGREEDDDEEEEAAKAGSMRGI